jgi:membrane protein YqaA with SNARE-associated domain
MSSYVFFVLVAICAAIGSYLGPKRGRSGVSIKQAIKNSEQAFERPISKEEHRKLRQKNQLLLVTLFALIILGTLLCLGAFGDW